MSNEEKNFSPLSKLTDYVRYMFSDRERYCVGRILTIVDGVIVDKEQKKAVKDLIHDVFSGKYYHTDSLEEMIGIFSDKYCPEIEKNCKYKIKRETNIPIQEFKF